MRRGLADPHKGSLDERRRRHRIKDTKRLCPGERGVVPHDARWGLFQMHRAGGGPEKIERSIRQDLWILRGGQPLPQTSKGRLLLAKYE